MRIMLVAHNVTFGDGQGRINLEIVRRAATLGHEVTIVADRIAPEVLGTNVQLRAVRPRFQKPNLLKVGSFLSQANQVVRQSASQFDVVVGNGNSITAPHHVNLCQFVHGAWGQSPVHVARIRRGPYAWYQQLYTSRNSSGEKRAFAASRFVVAPSNKIVDDLKSIGTPPDRIRVIYNGVDLDEFQPGPANRTDLKLPVGPLALFAGDIRTPRKNLDTVLRALARTHRLQLAVVGETRNSPFPDMARSLGIADRVTFLGFRRDINIIFRACDFFVFPSRYEAGSLVILEALASGLPVISAASAGGAELVTSDAGQVVTDSEDVGSIASAMQHLADRPDSRVSQSGAARRIAQQHSWTSMADQYLALFEESRREAPCR